MTDREEKKVDEEWKAQVERERALGSKGGVPGKTAEGGPESGPPEADFGFFLSSLSIEAMVALGEVPHPQTNALKEDLGQARYLIDLLGMLKTKTQGNLSSEESSLLENLLYELRMKYVSKVKP